MRRLVIVGAGGLGREVLSYINDINNSDGAESIQLLGFINDISDALERFGIGCPIIDSIEGHKIIENAEYICAIGDSVARMRICASLAAKGARFQNIIHPTARIRERVKIGKGNIIAPNVMIGPDVTIGDYVLLNGGTGIAHDCIIEDGCTINGYCSINGWSHLKKGVFMGSNAVIIPRRKIAEFAKISAGAVVFSHVKEGRTMFGNPATVLK